MATKAEEETTLEEPTTEPAAEDAVDDVDAPDKKSKADKLDTTDKPDEPDGPRRRFPAVPRGRLVVAAVVLVLLTSVITAVVQWREADRLRTSADTEQLVRTRSAEFGQALLAYRHTDLNTSKSRIRSLASADFGQSYETAFGNLAEVIGKYQAEATASVRDVYVNNIDGQRAKSLVVLDSEVRSTLGLRRVLGTKLLLELIFEHGSWKVNAMSNLPADDETLTKPDGTTERPAASPTPKPTP